MRWLLFPFTLPWTLTVGYGWVFLMMLIGAAKIPRFDFGYGVLTAEWKNWAAKIWGYSTTLGRGIIYQPDIRDEINGPSNMIERHEDVHVRQVEDLMVLSFVIGLIIYLITGNWLLGLLIWWSGGTWQLVDFFTAAIRFGWKNFYKDSEHERSAYAQCDLIRDAGMSWSELRTKERSESHS